jgi:DNA-binding YbaB/EbfC family protein
MQQQLADAQDAAAETELEGVAGGGAVRIRLTGAGDFLSVTIDPAAVDPADVEMLQDLVLAALHDATRRVQELQEASMSGGMAGLGDLLGGGGLGGLADLGGLFGGPDE